MTIIGTSTTRAAWVFQSELCPRISTYWLQILYCLEHWGIPRPCNPPPTWESWSQWGWWKSTCCMYDLMLWLYWPVPGNKFLMTFIPIKVSTSHVFPFFFDWMVPSIHKIGFCIAHHHISSPKCSIFLEYLPTSGLQKLVVIHVGKIFPWIQSGSCGAEVSFQGHAVDLEGVLDTLIYTPPHNMSAWD